MTMTYTYAELEISPAAYDEIEAKLKAAGYDQALHDGRLDMEGIALTRGPHWVRSDRGTI